MLRNDNRHYKHAASASTNAHGRAAASARLGALKDRLEEAETEHYTLGSENAVNGLEAYHKQDVTYELVCHRLLLLQGLVRQAEEAFWSYPNAAF